MSLTGSGASNTTARADMSVATYLLKAPENDMLRWKAQAAEAGVSFAEWVRAALDNAGEFARPDTTLVRHEPGRIKPVSRDDLEAAADVGGYVQDQLARHVGEPRSTPSAAACSRAAQHRAGVFCKECGRVPVPD